MNNKPVLVHVPKTAGSSMVRLPWLDYVGHDTYENAKKRFGLGRFYFAVVRHPVDRFIRCMEVVYLNIQNYPEYLQKMAICSFKKFIENLTNSLNEYDFCKDVTPIQYVLFRSQLMQIGNIPNIIYYEALIDGIQHIAHKVGAMFSPDDLQHLGAMTLAKPEINYKAKRLIEEYYWEDMERFYK